MSEQESSEELSDDCDEDIDDYYNNNDDFSSDIDDDDDDINASGFSLSNSYVKKRIEELEQFEYECLTQDQVKKLLQKDSETASSILHVPSSLCHLVLDSNKWKMSIISTRSSVPSECSKMLIESGAELAQTKHHVTPTKNMQPTSKHTCGVCFETFQLSYLFSLMCRHLYCQGCWKMHIETYCLNGMNGNVPCMENDCTLLCPDAFVAQFLSQKIVNKSRETLAELYYKFSLQRSILSHHQLRFCPGVDCNTVFYAKYPKPRKVVCSSCRTSCCFECGNPYHIPTDCETIKKWLTKCADDSETANYIVANTKDCPKCHICIEKHGGCNHMQCSKCKHEFCWMCLDDWRKHASSFYECSRYKENTVAIKNKQTNARDALQKYLFYFERWENHNQSLRLEAEARAKILAQIEEKVNNNEGTWIDWQYLLRAGELLAKCRYTLHYTYPLAYYAETGPEKTLFEYQQAQLEVEIEELAWKLEHVGDHQRGAIENQVDVCEKRTQTLLARFVQN